MKKWLVSFAVIALLCTGLLASSGQATTLSYNATCDNAFYMYISTDPSVLGTLFGSGNNWGATYSGSVALIPGVTQYLQIVGENWGGPASFIGDFTLSDANFSFVNGAQYLVTNINDFFVSATGFYLPPNVATDWGHNGIGPWGFHPAIDAGARWIWTDDYDGAAAFIVTVLTPIPLPPAALLLGSGLVCLVGLRKFRQS